MSFQQKIRTFAEENNYSYKDLARVLGIDVAVAHNMFYAGIVPDSLNLIKHIAVRMQMTPGYLLGYCATNDFTPLRSFGQVIAELPEGAEVYIKLDFGQVPFKVCDVPTELYSCLVLNQEEEQNGFHFELQLADKGAC